jgi:hypothetical protein
MVQRISHQWGTQATTHGVICLQINVLFIASTMFIRIGSHIFTSVEHVVRAEAVSKYSIGVAGDEQQNNGKMGFKTGSNVMYSCH